MTHERIYQRRGDYLSLCRFYRAALKLLLTLLFLLITARKTAELIATFLRVEQLKYGIQM
jgi:hypothetical protein